MSTFPRIDPEFKTLIPPLSADERTQLEQNILSCQKCHNALILWEGIIIDGHNRFEICVKHGIQFEVKEISFPSREDVKVWILENQLGRRNLNDATRIEIALVKAELLREKAKKRQMLSRLDKSSASKGLVKSSNPENEQINVRKIIADDADISEKTLHRYMQIKKEGSPELVAKVKSGEIKIGAAHKTLTKEITKELTKQLNQADKMYKYIAKHVPFESNEKANREIFAELKELQELLCDLMVEYDSKKIGA
jgi:hypothetical protein